MVYTIRPLLLGRMRINCSLFTYMMNFHKEIWAPIVSWYIRAGERNVLVDTGAPADVMRKYWYSDYEEIMSFEEALNSVNTSTGEIDVIIQTHLLLSNLFLLCWILTLGVEVAAGWRTIFFSDEII